MTQAEISRFQADINNFYQIDVPIVSMSGRFRENASANRALNNRPDPESAVIGLFLSNDWTSPRSRAIL